MDDEGVAADHLLDIVLALRSREEERTGGLGIVVATEGDHRAVREKASQIRPMRGPVLVTEVGAVVVQVFNDPMRHAAIVVTRSEFTKSPFSRCQGGLRYWRNDAAPTHRFEHAFEDNLA